MSFLPKENFVCEKWIEGNRSLFLEMLFICPSNMISFYFILLVSVLFSKIYPAVPTKVTVKIEVETNGGSEVHVSSQNGSLVVCSSAGCVYAAANLLNSINQSVDPCVDFYSYACGGWIDSNPIADDKTDRYVFLDAREKVKGQLKELLEADINENLPESPISMVKQLYLACLNTELNNTYGSEDLFADLQMVFGENLALLEKGPHDCNDQDMTKTLAHFHKVYPWKDVFGAPSGGNPFFTFAPAVDAMNTSRMLLHLDQGANSLGAGSRDIYLYSDFSDVQQALKLLVQKSINALLEDNGLKARDLKAQADDIITFETEYAKILAPDTELKKESEHYHLKKIKDLHEIIPFINWEDYLDIILPEDVRPFINDDTDIIVRQLDFFPKLAELIAKSDCSKRNNFVLWNLVHASLARLGEKFEDIYQEFNEVNTGQRKKMQKWDRCVKEVQDHIGEAVGAMYARKYFDGTDRKEAVVLVEQMLQAFTDVLDDTDWMDTKTRNFAMLKVQAMTPAIGFPDRAADDALLNDYYQSLDFGRNDSFYKLIKLTSQFELNRNFKNLLLAVDRRNDWPTTASVVNSYYQLKSNSIVFPAAVLQKPFFDDEYPKFVNYGGMGFVIGHEITHGFDDAGRQYDEIGSLHDWWEEATANQFSEKAQCFVDQYNHETVQGTGMQIDGKLTLGENIADNGGLKSSYLAYRRYVQLAGKEEAKLPGLTHLNGEQLFFLGAAQFWCGHTRPAKQIIRMLRDPHSPTKYRVGHICRCAIDSWGRWDALCFSNSGGTNKGKTYNPNPK